MSSEKKAEQRRSVLREVGVGECMEITDPARLYRLLAETKDAGDPKAQELIRKAEQLEERGVQ